MSATLDRLQEVLKEGSESHLMTGDQYKRSLSDGRKIIDADGNEVLDVVNHPALRNGIAHLAKLYDAQFDPETKDRMTYVDPDDGNRYGLGWMIPTTKDDLTRIRELNRIVTYHTMGIFGRANDYGGPTTISFLLIADKMASADPESAENIRRFIDINKKFNVMSTDIVPDVQSDRTVPRNERPGRLRIVEERPDGVVLRGAKPCASIAAQAHFATIATALSPNMDADSVIWGAVPLNAKGLTIVLREPVTDPDATFDDHPIDSFGEEVDNMLLFDDVFVPREYLFCIKDTNVLGFYRESGTLSFWHVLSRLMYRAEIFAGTAQTIVDVLGTGSFQRVREDIARVVSYAATLKAFVLAAEEECVLTNGVMAPSDELITAGRLHSIELYPEIMHILRDISGQGLISRFTEKTWNHPDVKSKFDEFLRGTGVSAREKNRLFNFVWDLTCSGNAARTALFENVNSTNAPVVKEILYNSYDRSDSVNFVREYLRLPPKTSVVQ